MTRISRRRCPCDAWDPWFGGGEGGEGALPARRPPHGVGLRDEGAVLVDVAHGDTGLGQGGADEADAVAALGAQLGAEDGDLLVLPQAGEAAQAVAERLRRAALGLAAELQAEVGVAPAAGRSEEDTSELQSRLH